MHALFFVRSLPCTAGGGELTSAGDDKTSRWCSPAMVT
jgi:hypothetical protein